MLIVSLYKSNLSLFLIIFNENFVNDSIHYIAVPKNAVSSTVSIRYTVSIFKGKC